MPVANPFSTHGAYNGFPSCFVSVDVSGYDHWTTFSGWDKNSVGVVTEASIEVSLQLAGKLYWNLYKATVDINNTVDAITNLYVTGEVDGVEVDSIEPEERVCAGSISTYTQGDSFGSVDLRQTYGIIRFYDGVTTDEANFVGYGGSLIDFTGDAATIRAETNDGLSDSVSAELGGYGDEITEAVEVYSYQLVDGIKFLFFGFADASGSGYTATVDAANLKSEIKDGATVSLIAKIDSLDFYTYP